MEEIQPGEKGDGSMPGPNNCKRNSLRRTGHGRVTTGRNGKLIHPVGSDTKTTKSLEVEFTSSMRDVAAIGGRRGRHRPNCMRHKDNVPESRIGI
jgi:hypothetical protein